MARIAITGANGFLGSHIAEYALSKGHDTFALLRKGADVSNLEHIDRLEKVTVDYSEIDGIAHALSTIGPLDLIVHNAGLTKSYTYDRYDKTNVQLTQKLLSAIAQSSVLSNQGRFAYISSLAAIGPVGTGAPQSNYGRSKIAAEKSVKSSGTPYMIYRPTGIYGPRDVQFVPLIKAIKLGLYPFMTPANHRMTLIHAQDAAANIIDLSLTFENETVHLEDGNVYSHEDLKGTFEDLLKVKAKKIAVPKPVVQLLLKATDVYNRGLKKFPVLSLEHYNEISQDWDYDFSQERLKLPLQIQYSLSEGFKDAIDYYKEQRLI